MKTNIRQIFTTLALVAGLQQALAQGTAFTYQGQFNDGASPATGSYDLKFTIYDSTNNPGIVVAGPLTNAATVISNGLFTVTLDFGSGVFSGPDRWLQIAARTNLGGSGTFITLSPREKLTPTPYAITAGNLTGVVPGTGIAGTYSSAVTLNNPLNSFSGNGGGLTNVNALTLGGLSAGNFWQTSGNSGTTANVNFLGTTDNRALTLRVNNTVALQYQPGSTLPNVVAGLAAFRPSIITSGVSGAVIAGGNAPSGGVTGFGGGDFMAVYDNDGAIGGGFGNKVGSNNGDITDAAFATVGGGVFNGAAAYAATVSGGDGNLAGGQRSFIGGGFGNQALADISVLGGGLQNSILANADYSTIGGGHGNIIQTNASASFIGGGTNNTIQSSASGSVIAGGFLNTIQSGAFASTIAGGVQNIIQYGSVLDAGAYSFIGAGQNNTIEHDAEASVIAGGLNNTIQFGNQVANINGGWQNSINRGPGAFDYSTLSCIGGGYLNGINGSSYAAIGGGNNNIIRNASTYSTIAGGWNNSTGTNALYATIGGGIGNFIQTNAQNATVGGGINNSCLANGATVPGGYNNIAGFTSFAAGTQARATNDASFVWADNQGTPFSSTANNQVSFRCLGGVRFTSGSGAVNQTVSWAPGSGSWSFSSDRALKEQFETVDSRAVLEKVASLPISEWNYKGYAQRHIGVMAQDFHAAFPLNESTTTLNDADLHGVTLAAIQGLNQKIDEQAEAIKTKDAHISDLEKRVERLEKLISTAAEKQ
jgi:hypothetical protein